MKIKRPENRVLKEQEFILTEKGLNTKKHVVLFRDKEKTRIVLSNVLGGKFMELLSKNNVMDCYLDNLNISVDYFIYEIRDLIGGTFFWASTQQGSRFWGNINTKLGLIIESYEDKET